MTAYETARAVLARIVADRYGAELSPAVLPASSTDSHALGVCRARARVTRGDLGWLVHTVPPVFVPTVGAFYEALRNA